MQCTDIHAGKYLLTTIPSNRNYLPSDFPSRTFLSFYTAVAYALTYPNFSIQQDFCSGSGKKVAFKGTINWLPVSFYSLGCSVHTLFICLGTSTSPPSLCLKLPGKQTKKLRPEIPWRTPTDPSPQIAMVTPEPGCFHVLPRHRQKNTIILLFPWTYWRQACLLPWHSRVEFQITAMFTSVHTANSNQFKDEGSAFVCFLFKMSPHYVSPS